MPELKRKASHMAGEFHEISWDSDGAPYSERFEDRFFSMDSGLAECQHVFLQGNQLPERWKEQKQFCIAELGFGTGLNFLETWRTWRACRGLDGRLEFVSFEAYPLRIEALEGALTQWTELSPLAAILLEHWSSNSNAGLSCEIDSQTYLSIIVADAVSGMRDWHGMANAWFLDGFSPAKNPDMWSASIAEQVYQHTAPKGSFSTYTSAGWVRRNFEAVGFEVTRSSGFGRKRHMLTGRKP